MTERPARLFLDTNAFLQLRDLKDLPWRGLLPDHDQVILFVGPTVIEELETHKNSDNRRRRDRARAAFRLIEEASTSEGFRLRLRDGGWPVDLVLADDPAPDWDRFEKLDRSRADDRLVAEVATHPAGARLFSHDSGPVIRARMNGVTALKAPDDWLLPAEQTDDQRKLAALARDLEQAKNAKTRLELLVHDEGADGFVTFERLVAPALGTDQRRWLERAYGERFPEAYLPEPPTGVLAMLQSHQYVGEEQRRRYWEEREQWRSKVRAFFETLHERLMVWSQVQTLHVEIANIGSISARELVVTVAARGELMLMAGEGTIEEMAAFAGPPEAPEVPTPMSQRWLAGRDFQALSPYAALNRPKDPTAFRWLRKPVPDEQDGRLLCSDFRPDIRRIQPFVLLGPNSDGAEGEIDIAISAEHHPSIERRANLRQVDRLVDWRDPAIGPRVPDIVAALLAAMPPDGE